VLSALASNARAADPDPIKAQCAEAYEQAQERRAASQLIEAKQALLVCAQAQCPGFVQKDCSQWLVDVQRQMPSVVIAAKAPDGSDTDQVRITLDGKLIASQLSATAIEINPGPHTFRFEYADQNPIELRILVRQAQRDRVIEVRFGPEPGSQAPQPLPPAGEGEGAGKAGPLRPYAYVAGAVGAVGLAGFAVFGLLGRQRENELNDECGGRCAESDVDGVKKKYLLADISLGVGIVGLGVGTALFLMSRPESRPTNGALKVDVAAVRGGGQALFSTQF
jgi:hypothetical protein